MDISEAAKIQRSSRGPRRYGERRLRCMLSFHTEQGSSASQMTAAKVMNFSERLPGCAGQTADAVSANTEVK